MSTYCVQYNTSMKSILLLLILIGGCISQRYNWQPVEDKINYYLANTAFPGGVLRVANRTHTLYNSVFGSLSNGKIPFSSPSFTNDTIFDIASLTKVTATLSCIMTLFEQKKIGIDDLVTKYIPQYGNGKEKTTIRNLLLHNAGLLPDYPSPLPKTKKQVMDFIYTCKVNYTIGTKFIYSDLSFITLGEISERISGLPLQVFSKQRMVKMGMLNSTFLPNLTELQLNTVVQSFYTLVKRKELIRGQVHDPTAYLFGGVAGHAGFFSVVDDLQTYMQIHLREGITLNGTRIYSQDTVKTFYTRQDGLPYNNRRALGWDTVPIQENPPCGTLFSLNSFGHTGFTGTMMWADRDKGLVVVLLANRVHPTALSGLMPEARCKIVDEVVKTLGY